MDLEISERISEGVVIMELAGMATNSEAANRVRARLKEILQDGNMRVVLDLKRLSYIDSAGLGALVASYTTARNQGSAMKLANPDKQFREQLEMTKLISVLEVYDTVEEALRSFS